MSDLNAENKQIRLPKSYYVGYIGRTEDELTLAFMTEDGTDKAAEKRKETVNQWVRQNARREKSVEVFRTYENTPLIGFRLGRSIRRYSSWGSGNVKWRIEDPRGFELEISSPNMANIIASAVLDNGEILEECIWARLKGDNVLVPLSSDLYKALTRNEERLSSKVKPSEVERGDYVVLQNGQEGVYLGKFECLTRHYDYNSNAQRLFSYQWKKKPVHAMIFQTKDSEGKIKEHLTDFSTFKPSYCTKREGGPLTPEEAEMKAAQLTPSHGDKLSLSKPSMSYVVEDTTLAEALTDVRATDQQSGKLVCVRGDAMYMVSLQKWQYDQYLAQKSGQVVQPRGFFTNRLSAGLTKLSVDDEGHYILHHDRGSYSFSNSRLEMTIDELEKLPLKLISNSISLSSATKLQLS